MAIDKKKFKAVESGKRGRRSTKMYLRVTEGSENKSARCYLSKAAVEFINEHGNDWQMMVSENADAIAFQPVTKDAPRKSLQLFTSAKLEKLLGDIPKDGIELTLTVSDDWLVADLE